MATIFEAQWGGGTCIECGDPIKRGESVTYAGDDIVHEECGYSPFNFDERTDWKEYDVEE